MYTIKQITIDMLEESQSPSIIDVRETDEFELGHVPNAENIPMQSLLSNPNQFLNKQDTYYIICQSGNRSNQVCMELIREGYTVVNIIGGTRAYIEKYGGK